MEPFQYNDVPKQHVDDTIAYLNSITKEQLAVYPYSTVEDLIHTLQGRPRRHKEYHDRCRSTEDDNQHATPPDVDPLLIALRDEMEELRVNFQTLTDAHNTSCTLRENGDHRLNERISSANESIRQILQFNRTWEHRATSAEMRITTLERALSGQTRLVVTIETEDDEDDDRARDDD